MPSRHNPLFLFTIGVLLAGLFGSPGYAQTQLGSQAPAPEGTTFEMTELVDAGHQLFGQTSAGFASAVEFVFSELGQPVGYIVGEEASGAIIGGLRYGEGELRMKSGAYQKVFWQGPTLGFDLGADGSRVMVLVYHLNFPSQIYDTYTSTGGMAYVAGGLGVNFQSSEPGIILAMIRTGIGLRLGINLGYLNYTPEPTWNPF